MPVLGDGGSLLYDRPSRSSMRIKKPAHISVQDHLYDPPGHDHGANAEHFTISFHSSE